MEGGGGEGWYHSIPIILVGWRFIFFFLRSVFSPLLFFLVFLFFFFCMDLSLGGFLIEVDETGKNFAILANLWESYLSTPCVLGWL